MKDECHLSKEKWKKRLSRKKSHREQNHIGEKVSYVEQKNVPQFCEKLEQHRIIELSESENIHSMCYPIQQPLATWLLST